MRIATVGFELGRPRDFLTTPLSEADQTTPGFSYSVGIFHNLNLTSSLTAGAFAASTVTREAGHNRTEDSCLRFASQNDHNPEMPPVLIGRLWPRAENVPSGLASPTASGVYDGCVFRGTFKLVGSGSLPRTGAKTEILALAPTEFNDVPDRITRPLLGVFIDEFGRLSVRHKIGTSSSGQSYAAGGLARAGWLSDPLEPDRVYTIEAAVTWGTPSPNEGGNVAALRIDGETVWIGCANRVSSYMTGSPCALIGWGRSVGPSVLSPAIGPGAGKVLEWDNVAVNDLREDADAPLSDSQTTWPGSGAVYTLYPSATLAPLEPPYGWARGTTESFFGMQMHGTAGQFQDPYPDQVDLWEPGFKPPGTIDSAQIHAGLGADFDTVGTETIADLYDVDDLRRTWESDTWKDNIDNQITNGPRDAYLSEEAAARPPVNSQPVEAALNGRADIPWGVDREPPPGPYPDGGPAFVFNVPVPASLFDDLGAARTVHALIQNHYEGPPGDEPRPLTSGGAQIMEPLDPHKIGHELTDDGDTDPADLERPWEDIHTGFYEDGNRIMFSRIAYNPVIPPTEFVKTGFQRINSRRTYGREAYEGMGVRSYSTHALIVDAGAPQPPLPTCQGYPDVPGTIEAGPVERKVYRALLPRTGRVIDG